MAITQENLYLLIILSSYLFLYNHSCSAHSLASCQFDTIYQFGDSYSDTGNLALLAPQVPCNQPPYGQSLPDKATGRCSDGLLIVDYIAKESGLSFIEPYYNKTSTHISGVNFAIAGAPACFLYENQLQRVPAIREQLDLFSKYHNGSSCSKDRFQRSLFIMGQIGLNDYNNAFIHEKFGNKSPQEIDIMVQNVIHAIKDAVKFVIGYGAVNIIVPGQWPVGCLPIYLKKFATDDIAAYDQFQCLNNWNSLALSHNYHLINTIEELKKAYPNVTIVYADYYNAFECLLTHQEEFGFDGVDKMCCGVKDGAEDKACSISPDMNLCSNPDNLISWDGIHMTQQAHKQIAKRLIRDLLRDINCGQS